MLRVDENTPYDDFTIQSLTFSVPQPYKAGDQLDEAEASQLNQVFAENIRNNFAAKIRARIEDYRKANNLPEDQEIGVDVLDKDELDAALADYASKYEFGVRQSSGAPRAPADPIGKEAHKIAREKVKAALQKKNIKLDSVSKEKMSDLIKQVLEKYPEIREEAERRVNATSEIAMSELEL